MTKYITIFLCIIITSCQSLNIKDRTYKVSSATTELGSIGLSNSLYIKNNFSLHALPVLENKIRVDISIVPFNKKLNKFYIQKSKYNQNQSKIQYIDSLDTKPEIVTITILDVAGYIAEINSTYNNDVITYLKDTRKANIITSIATTLSSEDIIKIRNADNYYLINNQQKKYDLVLYKANKKTETINLKSGVVLGYELGKTCWAINRKNNWYLADIIKDCISCKGKTHTKIKEKETSSNLFKM